jgi:hypothetical protein
MQVFDEMATNGEKHFMATSGGADSLIGLRKPSSTQVHLCVHRRGKLLSGQ